MTIGVFEVRPHFRMILPQIQKLLTVKSFTLHLSYKLYPIFISHSTFDSCSGSKHQSSPRARNTMNSNTTTRLFTKLNFYIKTLPVIDHLFGWCCSIMKRPIRNMNVFFLHKSGVVSCFTCSYYCSKFVLLKFLYIFA